ncbi:MAG: T9SS type A sorting domain-containing protein [Saprospirales bacterium]|nr:T9SS type A sorting domain-containing protein [Saprospirales bacterium]
MRNLILSSLFLLSCCAGSTQTAPKVISGYYPGWRWYERGKLVQPATIDYSRYHLIYYAFLSVDADGSLRLTDPWADKNLLLGPVNGTKAPPGYGQSNDLGNPAFHQAGKRFSDYAHKNKVRFLVSIGGWAHSEFFSAVAADPVKRAHFASQCATIIQLYNLDGIDIDWEYPGYEERGGSAADRDNFTRLLRQLRATLDALEPKLRRELALTIACSASPRRMETIDWIQVRTLVDGVNLMSYAFYGHWDPVSNHNAPLFPPVNATQPGFSCSEAVQNLLDLGVPAAKINLGLAFYGRTQLTGGPAGLHTGGLKCPDTLRFGRNATTPAYYEIAHKIRQGLYDYHWDEVAQAPYLTGKNGMPSFVSFDDEQSTALKALFARSRRLHGVVIWDITADYLESAPGSGVIAGTPLATAVKNTFTASAPPVPEVLAGANISVFPNPTANGYLQIFTNATERARTDLAVFNTEGQKLHAITYSEASHRLDLRALPAGPYLVQVKHGKSQPILVRIIKK